MKTPKVDFQPPEFHLLDRLSQIEEMEWTSVSEELTDSSDSVAQGTLVGSRFRVDEINGNIYLFDEEAKRIVLVPMVASNDTRNATQQIKDILERVRDSVL